MIARATRFAAALLAAGLWLACGFWTHVPPHERELAPRYSVHAQTDWSARKSGATELWTIHGPSLEALRLTNGLADGKPLAPPHAYKEQMPLFHAAMSGSEVAELVVETLARTGAGNVELQDVSPAPFAGQPGFEIDLSFSNPSGLAMSALGAGAVVDGKLYLILFSAPRLHYFAATRPTVERLIASARFAPAGDN